MTRLEPQAYLDHLRADSQRFRDVLAACDPSALVPSCPEWTADDLLWHLAEVQHWWGYLVQHRPASPENYQEPERPGDRAGLLGAYDAWSAAFLEAIESADPQDEAWSWHYDKASHTIG